MTAPTGFDPTRLADAMNRGRAHQQAGAYPEALAAFDEAIAMAPLYAAAYADRGATRLLMKQAARALPDLGIAIALASGAERAASYFNRALAHEAQGEPVRAVRDFRAALAGGHREAEAELARLCVVDATPGVRDLARAQLLCREAFARASRDPVAAIAMFQEASELAPDRADAFHGLGVVRAALGHDADAIAAFGLALAREPSHPGMRAEGLFNRGMLRARANQHVGALDDLEACLALAEDPRTEFPRVGDPVREQEIMAKLRAHIARLRGLVTTPD